MLDPTYNDPPDVSRSCGHFLICQVHVTRRPPHSPHFTRSDMPQRRMLQHNSPLCPEDIERCGRVLSASSPSGNAACAKPRPVARHAHCRKQSLTWAPIRLRAQSLSVVTTATFFYTLTSMQAKRPDVQAYNCSERQTIVNVKLWLCLIKHQAMKVHSEWTVNTR
jgi:hypothetical protein